MLPPPHHASDIRIQAKYAIEAARTIFRHGLEPNFYLRESNFEKEFASLAHKVTTDAVRFVCLHNEFKRSDQLSVLNYFGHDHAQQLGIPFFAKLLKQRDLTYARAGLLAISGSIQLQTWVPRSNEIESFCVKTYEDWRGVYAWNLIDILKHLQTQRSIDDLILIAETADEVDRGFAIEAIKHLDKPKEDQDIAKIASYLRNQANGLSK